MGDKKRFQVFADFIGEVFSQPNTVSIADVAGGQGYLSLELIRRGYKSEIIDLRNTELSCRDRKFCRENGIVIPRKKKLYSFYESVNYDLIVGLHPDGATESICKSAFFRDVAIVPCCNFWKTGGGDIEDIIRKFFDENEIPYRSRRLRIGGRNTVFFTYNHQK